MSPDLYFVLTLLVRMAVTATFVLSATIAAERAGPLVGGLVAALPVSAGPVYIFLAIDHGAAFIADSALSSMVAIATTSSFAIVYSLLAQKQSMLVSLLGAFAFWLGLSLVAASLVVGSVIATLAFTTIVMAIALASSAALRHVTFPRTRTYFTDYLLRALLVAALVGSVVTLSHYIGPDWSGLLAIFPVVFISLIIIMHRRVGGPAAAAVLSNAVIGLVGLALAMLVVHFTALRIGSVLALFLGLVIAVVSNIVVFVVIRRRRTKPA